jgi:hypothetical protein
MKNCINYKIIVMLLITLQSTAQIKLPAGYPDRSPSFDVLPGFIKPPKGYGEVPFYWWQGDTLTHERLTWQLDKLANKGISSLQINYSHLDYGGLSYGLSRPSRPALFTDEWWKLFKWFAAEAQKREMTVSLSDYTIGIGQGFSMDEALKNNPGLNGSVLRTTINITTGKGNIHLPENLLTLSAYKLNKDSSFVIETRKDLLPIVKNNTLYYDFGIEAWEIIAVFPETLVPSYDPMNPKSGKAYNQYFFGKFEEALPAKDSGALNFFFSDELNFRVRGNLWNSSFADEFKKRKGYDIVPYLDAIFVEAGNITPKIRLDYNDVLVSLSEENFFKPVYQWHQDRGLIFGCDHGGRGREVDEFGDYFRTQRWNQGPGSDQPRLSKDIVKAKVASSIAHLYLRPRVWLEGFHSSGWSTSSADVTDAIFSNFVAGYNLLSFHGLYYSTHGGWWEWAPPDNHFRMPYWNQIDPLMNCIQRLSYLLSQGYHSCDVAIIYPVEPVVADMDGERSVSTAFGAGEKLYDKGIDFDFIDFESLARSEVRNKELNISGEKYKVLIIPSMKAIRFSSLKKIEEFKKGGGIIVNIGEKPESTEVKGKNDPEVTSLVSGIYSKSNNLVQCDDITALPSLISNKYKANFKILADVKERPYVMHRVIGKRDIFALYNFQKGTSCFFKAKGQVQLWNPWNGEILSLENFSKQTKEGTEVTLPLSEKEIQIIVFDTDFSGSKIVLEKKEVTRQITLDNNWGFELKPSLDNKWGDFQFPAKSEMIGAQIRQLNFAGTKEYNGGIISLDSTWKKVTCSYGTQFLKLGALPDLPSEIELLKLDTRDKKASVTISGKKYYWEEYQFSWQQGVEGDFGHQGYHGLKGEMYDNFIRLGAMEDVRMSKKRVPESFGNYYILSTSVISADEGAFELLTGEVKPLMLFINNSKTDISSNTVSLKKGANKLLMVYDRACETYLVFRNPAIPKPAKQPVSMCWYEDYGVLPFDCSGDSNSFGLFAFESAPGLQSFTFSAYGEITTWINGVEIQAATGQKQPDGLTNYKVTIKDFIPTSSQVVIRINYQPGCYGSGAIPEYFRQECGRGTITLGDWSEIDGLRSYSGGAWYRKTFNLEASDVKNRLEIDLGDLVSSAELYINGNSAGIKLSPPWNFDISKYARQGENQIEVLVYNTLANNYTSIPTMYRGNIKSGLFGPVTIKIEQ